MFSHRVQIRQFGSRTDWLATKEKGNFSAATATGNSRALKAAGGASLTDWRDPVLRQRPSAKLWDRDLMRKGDVWELYTICSNFRVAWLPRAMAEEAKQTSRSRWDWQLLQRKLQPENDSTHSILACLSSPYVFLFTKDSRKLNAPNVATCEPWMLSSCLTPQNNVCSSVVLKMSCNCNHLLVW